VLHKTMSASHFTTVFGSTLDDWGLSVDDEIEVTEDGLIRITTREIDTTPELPEYVRWMIQCAFFPIPTPHLE